jgi:hexokinase
MDTTRSSRRPVKATLTPKTPPSASSWSSIWRDSAWPSLVTHTLAVVVGAVILAFLAPRFPHTVREIFDRTQHWRVSSPYTPPPNPIVFHQQPVCPKPKQHVEFRGTFNTRPERSMALADQAKRVAAEFDFGQDAVNKAVNEFIREMGMRRTACGAVDTLTTGR